MQHSKTINVIDLGSSKITTLIGHHFPSEKRFNCIAVSSVPALGFKKGQIIDLELAGQTITDSIESAERMAGQNIQSAHISFAAPHIESINSTGVVAVTSANREIDYTDIERVTQAAQAISLPPDKEIIHCIPRIFTIDGQEGITDPIGMSGIRLELEAHLILANSSAVKNIKKVFHEIGINIQSFSYSGLPTAHEALTDTEKDLGSVLIDIGGQITTVTIFTQKAPAFSTVLPIGSNNITNDLAIGLRLPLDQAEKIKIKLPKVIKDKNFEDDIDLKEFDIKNSDTNKISTQTAITGIINPRLEEIFSLIKQTIYQTNFQDLIPSGIVLTGGGSQTINIKKVASQILPLTIRIAQPHRLGGVVDDILNPAYTTTIGQLDYSLSFQKQPESDKKNSKKSFTNFFDKIKGLIEPLLP